MLFHVPEDCFLGKCNTVIEACPKNLILFIAIHVKRAVDGVPIFLVQCNRLSCLTITRVYVGCKVARLLFQLKLEEQPLYEWHF